MGETGPQNLEQLLDRIGSACEGEDAVSLKEILNILGPGSFGPLLILAGLIILMPLLGDVPGVPTVIALFVLLAALQLLVGRNHFWLPRWLLRLRTGRGKLCSAIERMRRPSRAADRLIRNRIPFFTGKTGHYAIAAACVLIALTIPLMEMIPFSANGAGFALTVFGLALIARDGLLALAGLIFTIGTYGFILFAVVYG